MPKSASTLLCELTRMACGEVHGGAGQEAIYRATKNGVIKGVKSYIQDLYKPSTIKLLHEISLEEGPFIIKIHQPLNRTIQGILERGEAKASYIYRDPRDAILSAMSNFRRTQQSRNVEFRDFATFESSLKQYINIARQAVDWKVSNAAITIKYEEFIDDMHAQLRRVLDYFGFEIPRDQIDEIIAQARSKQQAKGWNLRFNKGIAGRYRDEMSANQIDRCRSEFGSLLNDLGYRT